MSGWDWLVVLLLAGGLIVDVAFDQLRARRRRNWYEDPCDCWMCTGTRQHQQDREFEELP